MEKLTIQQIKQSLSNREINLLGHEDYHKSAVLLPLVERNGELSILFEVRAHHLRRQPGEICFPGGRIDPMDLHAQDTAIRETCEELGIEREKIEIIKALDFLPTKFGAMIFPYVARIHQHESITPSPDEVAEIFYVPLRDLLDMTPEQHYINIRFEPEENFPFDLIPNGKSYNWSKSRIIEYFYHYENYVIWGLTARILHHFLSLLKK